jgi:hypothetical protein
MAALILQFLPYLFQAATTIPQIWDYIQKVKADLQQKGQWSKEMEEAFNLELQNLEANPPDWWKPEDAA